MKSRLDRHAIGVDPLLSENSILMARSLHLSPFAVPASYFAQQASYSALQASKDRSKDRQGCLPAVYLPPAICLTAISTSLRFHFVPVQPLPSLRDHSAIGSGAAVPVDEAYQKLRNEAAAAALVREEFRK